ncbi:hypothetical protein HMPREF1548_00421 [Clostridium sp. KLE 1755]|nr:hypothetical protein HMPREF1548_00421 [Clostridium sp. KLE 1755]
MGSSGEAGRLYGFVVVLSRPHRGVPAVSVRGAGVFCCLSDLGRF